MSTSDVIVIPVGTQTVTESNSFLRRLWGLLNTVKENAWCYTPYTDTKCHKVYIGSNNVGTFWFDYINKGSIRNLYIDDLKIEKKTIEEIVEKAKMDISEDDFFVEYSFTHDDCFKMAFQSYNNICIYETDDSTKIVILMRAYSELDVEFWALQKKVAIQHLMFVYTQKHFQSEKVTVARQAHFGQSKRFDYNYEWYDSDECPKNEEGEYCLPETFFEIINSICEEQFYSKFVAAMVYSAQMLHNSYALQRLQFSHREEKIDNTGLFDLLNVGIVSSLEAIVSAEDITIEKCNCCGQDKYAISKRVHDLVSRYLGETMADHVKKWIYNNRSKYLHTGKTITPLYYYGKCYPLIDPESKREMLRAETPFEYNMIDFCTHILRKYIRDHYIN